MIIKIHLEKAYDRLEQGFIKETLIDAGLPMQNVETTCKCIKSRAFRLLWNGEVTDMIKPKREVYQGDAISPYIFVLCLESLTHLIQTKVDESSWKQIKASHRSPQISHIFC